MGKTMNSHKSSREKLKIFKNSPKKCKICVFRDCTKSRTSRKDKYFSRLEVPPTRKSRRDPRKLLSKLVAKASTCEQVAN